MALSDDPYLADVDVTSTQTPVCTPAGAGFIVTPSARSLDERGERLRKTDAQTFAFTATGDDDDEASALVHGRRGAGARRGAILSRWRGTS